METVNDSCKLVEKLIVVFRKLTETHFKIADDSYLEKLLTNVKEEIDKNGCKHLQSHLFIKTFENTVKIWEQTPPDAAIAGFVVRFIGIFARNEKDFNTIQEFHVVDGLLHCLDMEVYGSSPLKVAYVSLLTDAISHESGFSWVKSTKSWRNVIKLCFCNSSIYVEREAGKFITKFLSLVIKDHEINEELLREVLFPLITCETVNVTSGMDSEAVVSFEEKLHRRIGPSLRLFYVTLDFCITTPGSNLIQELILNKFDVQPILKSLIEVIESESLLETLATTSALLLLMAHERKNENMIISEIPNEIYDLFKILAKRPKIYNILKLAKLCQILWKKISLRTSFTAKFDSEPEINFIVIQIIPLMMFIRSSNPKNAFLDMYVDKLFNITTENTQRLAYTVRDVLLSAADSYPMDYALKGVLSLTRNIKSLSLDRAVLIFQALAYVFKEFIPYGCSEDPPMTDDQIEKVEMLSATGSTLLSAILNALCTLISTFHINWPEALESLCLLKFTSILLDNKNLSPLLAVQTLLLIKLSIKNFMSPHLALLTNKVEGTSFDCLVPLLYKRLHDPNWEIRDSCVEVVTVIADLADSKYTAFQELLIQHNLYGLIVNIVEGDSESYVRASALRATSAMIKIDRLWNQYLNSLDIPSKAIHILRNDSEGIVRREAALLIKDIFEYQHLRPQVLNSVYEVMGYAAIYDLHWEVKVNALFFWEKAVHKFLANQGMIDGSFPSVTFSKEHKKIVTLNDAEIKLRLNKALKELSNNGCLHVLLTTLNDDCDFQVVKKSAQIIKDFLSILNRYKLIQTEDNSMSCDKNSVKRKTSDEGCCEKKMHVDHQPVQKSSEEINPENDMEAKSQKVIEDIVNEMDINLLVSVCNSRQKKSAKHSENISLKIVHPDVFLEQLRTIDLKSFLDEKSKWLVDSGGDLSTLLNDILTVHSECEMNVLDCY